MTIKQLSFTISFPPKYTSLCIFCNLLDTVYIHTHYYYYYFGSCGYISFTLRIYGYKWLLRRNHQTPCKGIRKKKKELKLTKKHKTKKLKDRQIIQIEICREEPQIINNGYTIWISLRESSLRSKAHNTPKKVRESTGSKNKSSKY